MAFDIGKLSGDFRNTIDWMLEDKCGGDIVSDLQKFKSIKQEIETNPDSLQALRLLVELKITNSWYRPMPRNFAADFDSFIMKYGENFRTTRAANELAALIERHSRFPQKGKVRDWTSMLLNDFLTLRDFTRKLYELRVQGKKSDVLGMKGSDNYLRDVGYWDVIPIDIHQKRFLIRSGIYHAFSVYREQDPLDPRSLQGDLSRFCSLFLRGKIVEDIDLSNAPGIVDIFIWSYCAKERYSLCGSTPKCDTCRLNDTCLFGITNLQRAHKLGRIQYLKQK